MIPSKQFSNNSKERSRKSSVTSIKSNSGQLLSYIFGKEDFLAEYKQNSKHLMERVKPYKQKEISIDFK